MRNNKIQVVLHAVLLIASIIYIFPLLWMIINSFKPETEIFTDLVEGGALSISTNSSFENYVRVVIEYNILSYIGNTLLYATIAIVVGLIVNALCGYALAKMKFPFSDKILGIIILLLVIPLETIIITNYLIINNLGLSNTVLGYILPMLASPFFIYTFRQFFIQLEDEIEEAASLDGASTLRYFFEFVIPMSKPVFATVAVFIFLSVWNDFLWPILVFSDNSKLPIQIGLNALFNNQTVTLGEKLATLTIVTIPVILVYSIFQKYIIQGVGSMGSSKE